ncbi:LPS export ABC transporter periplasmic protein LptC [Tahibacter aquaticus]|uniref:LPS export ABC transporter periplasmic protein LptC n=1 Tax=Tahibacter aquaticus TaxID=520092 RepID=UPI001414EE20|nr:LPS export ABC transporter periplasmic protein LptC [Tahibacter aquaticus]
MAVTDESRLRLILLLAVVASAIWAALWYLRPPEEVPAFVGPPRSNYTLDNFTLHALDEEGKLSFTVSAPALARRNDDGSLWVDAPDFLIAAKQGEPWKGTSQSAFVTKDGTHMLLAGAVEMQRAPSPEAAEAHIATRDVDAYPKENRLETAAAATITQPGSILRGTGMKADLNTHQLELLSDVHASFARKRKP